MPASFWVADAAADAYCAVVDTVPPKVFGAVEVNCADSCVSPSASWPAPAAESLAPVVSLSSPDDRSLAPVPSCPAPEASAVAPPGSCAAPVAACCAPLASWSAPLAAWPSWSCRFVNPMSTFVRYCSETALPNTDAAVCVIVAVIAASTTRPSGAVCTWMVAFSGVLPGAVEVAAAEKFSGIVITAS